MTAAKTVATFRDRGGFNARSRRSPQRVWMIHRDDCRMIADTPAYRLRPASDTDGAASVRFCKICQPTPTKEA